MNSGELLEIALKAGEILLKSGAEIYRVEDTIKRICGSYSFYGESFVLPTGIFISVKDKEGSEPHTTFKRIVQRTVDLRRIEMVNDFSRSLSTDTVTYDDAMGILSSIEKEVTWPFVSRLAAAGIASFVFTLLFKGSLYDGIVAFIIGIVIFSLKEALSKVGFFQFFELFMCGLAAGVASIFSVWLFPELSLFKIIIGSIMIFLPGVAITNSIKDALYGDIVASISRLGEAFFVVAAVGVGVGIAVSVGLSWGV
jgi:Uncharacterized conserved protein